MAELGDEPIFINYNPELEKSFAKNQRAGWKYALSAFENFPIHPNAIQFDSFVDKTFLWGGKNFKKRRHIFPWIGILHNPPGIIFKKKSPQYLLKQKRFLQSLKNCKGLFVLSNYLKEWLKIQKFMLNIKINVIYLPTETPSENLWFTMDKFQENQNKQIIQIGFALRKKESIFKLGSLKFLNRVILPCTKRMHMEYKYETGTDIPNNPNVIQMEHISNEHYDQLLSQNIVFLDLFDSSANNSIIECVVRNTPILVKDLPAVREYLGENYPFYFTNLEQAREKANNLQLILQTHEYLKNYKTKEKFTKKYFIQSILQSEIYQSLKLRHLNFSNHI